MVAKQASFYLCFKFKYFQIFILIIIFSLFISNSLITPPIFSPALY